MALSKEARENMPKRPANTYIMFICKKMAEYGDDVDNKRKAALKQWKQLDKEDHEKLDKEYQAAKKKYEEKFEQWKKQYNVDDDDLDNKSKNKDHDEEETKPEKTKGRKNKSAEKSGKKDQKKSKSKGKGKK